MIGARLGPYAIHAELGSGGMGKVFQAESQDGVVVAVKVIHPHLLESPGFFERFLREARIGRQVRHENVVRCLDCDAHPVDGQPVHYLVMEYVEGQTLRELLDEMGTVPEELCRHIGREAAKGLAAIHAAGAMHRDLKPENVLITREHQVKIMDLGLARLVDEATRLSQTGQFVGSVLYAAPEALRGRDIDGRVDLHGLGLVLYELATGQQPFRHDDMQAVLRHVLETVPRRAGELNPQLSPFFEEVLATLLQKDVNDRFRAATDLLEVLAAGEAAPWWKERSAAIRSATRKPLRRVRIPRETAVYGRDDDLAWLDAAFAAATDSRGRVLLVEGEAGIGKTRLVDEFVGRLERAGEEVNFLRGTYPPGGAATASGAWSTAYREQFGEAGSGSWLEKAPALVPSFDALLRGEPSPEGEPPLTKATLQTAFVRATQALAAERPTIVLIEDLHLAPEEGRALFAALAMAVSSHPVLLIGTSRPELPEAWIASLTRMESVEQRTLQRLGAKDLALLLEEAFHSERLAEQLGVRIARKSDGNPFFAFEIVRGLKEGQFLTRKPDGSWVSTGAIGELEVPASVLDLVKARVADLDEDDRDLLDVAACIGFAFDPTLAADAAGVPLLPALKRLGQIERRSRLIRTAGAECVFDHHQVQEALYESQMPKLREVRHAAIGDALGRAHPEPTGAQAVAMCQHLLRGARGKRALPHLDAALTHLRESYLNGATVALADLALAAPGLLEGEARLKILLEKSNRLENMGLREPREAVLVEAGTLATDVGQSYVAKVEHALGGLRLLQGRFDEAQAHFEATLATGREIDDAECQQGALGNLGNLFAYQGQYDKARTLFEKQLAVAEAQGDRLTFARGIGNLGLLDTLQGRRDEAMERLGTQLALTRELGDRWGELYGLGNLGVLRCTAGHFDQAMAHFEQCLEISRTFGDRDGEAWAHSNLGLVHLELGRYAEAIRAYDRSLAAAQEIGSLRVAANARNGLGSVHYYLGRFEEAADAQQQSADHAREMGDHPALAMAAGDLGLVRLEQGRLDEAKAALEESLETAKALCDQLREADAHLALGRLALRRGTESEAATHFDEAIRLGGAVVLPGVHVEAAGWRARLPDGDPDRALALLHQYGDRAAPARRLAAWFGIYVATGSVGHLEEAQRLRDALVEHAPEEDRISMVENVALLREVTEAGR